MLNTKNDKKEKNEKNEKREAYMKNAFREKTNTKIRYNDFKIKNIGKVVEIKFFYDFDILQ